MKKSKFNIIDIAIITMLIIIVAITVLRVQKTNALRGEMQNEQIQYTINIYQEDIAYKNALNIDDKLYLTNKNLYCGTVKSVTSEYASQTIEHPDGTASEHINPSLVNIEVTIQVSGDLTETGFYIGNNTYITTGQYLDMYTPEFEFNCQITDVASDVSE